MMMLQQPMPRLCKICKREISGRPEKIFCSVTCKSYYHQKLRAVTKEAALPLDRILHRNKSILLEVMGKNKTQKKVPRSVLDKKHFKFEYLTNYYVNSKSKMYHCLYDFAWMEFTDGEILIVRRKVAHVR